MILTPFSLPPSRVSPPSSSFLFLCFVLCQHNMKHSAAYLLLQLGGNQEPSVDDMRRVLSSVGIAMDGDRAARVVASMAATELVASGPALPANVWPVEMYGLKFGIEIEVYLKPLRDKVYQNWSEVAEDVGEALRTSYVSAMAGEKDSRFALWSVIRDPTVRDRPEENKCQCHPPSSKLIYAESSRGVRICFAGACIC